MLTLLDPEKFITLDSIQNRRIEVLRSALGTIAI